MFQDAKKLAEKHPDTFQRTTSYETVKPGNFVKIADKHERFWVLVTEVNPPKIMGTIHSNLIYSSLSWGDAVDFIEDNIYDIYIGEPGKGSEEGNIQSVCTTCNITR